MEFTTSRLRVRSFAREDEEALHRLLVRSRSDALDGAALFPRPDPGLFAPCGAVSAAIGLCGGIFIYKLYNWICNLSPVYTAL